LIVYNHRNNTITEYTFDFQIVSMAGHGSNIYISDGNNIYLLNDSGNVKSSFRTGNIDVDVPDIKNKMYIYISGKMMSDGTLILTTENDSYSYSITPIRTEGERRVTIGKGLKGRLKDIEITSDYPYEIDRIRIEANPTRRVR
jgi:hypothetical protein